MTSIRHLVPGHWKRRHRETKPMGDAKRDNEYMQRMHDELKGEDEE